MALDLMKEERTSAEHEGKVYVSVTAVPASYLVARLAEECPEIWDDDPCEYQSPVTIEAADYEWPRGLEVSAKGKRYRLKVTAELINNNKE